MGSRARRRFSTRMLGVAATAGAAHLLHLRWQHSVAAQPLPRSTTLPSEHQLASSIEHRRRVLDRVTASPSDSSASFSSSSSSSSSSSQRGGDAVYDIVVVGGGAAGLFCALDGALRGYSVLLLEADDIGSGNSSLSAKLLHTGVMHVQRGIRQRDMLEQASNAALQLSELRTLERIAGQHVRRVSLLVPFTRWNEGVELWLSGKLASLISVSSGLRRSSLALPSAFCSAVPSADREDTQVRGALRVSQYTINESRVCVALAQTAAEAGADILTHCRVSRMSLAEGSGGTITASDGGGKLVLIEGHTTESAERTRHMRCVARHVINATGPSIAATCKLLDGIDTPDFVEGHIGVSHLVVRRGGLIGFGGKEGEEGLIVSGEEQTARNFFVVPSFDPNYLLVGAATSPCRGTAATNDESSSGRPNTSDIETILSALETFGLRLRSASDVVSVQRPVAALLDPSCQTTVAAIRDAMQDGHSVCRLNDGVPLITLFGGSWTSVRAMAEKAIDMVSTAPPTAGAAPLEQQRRCSTRDVLLCGWEEKETRMQNERRDDDDSTNNKGNEEVPGSASSPPPLWNEEEVAHAVDHEFCRTLVDFIARRRNIAFTHGRELLAPPARPSKLTSEAPLTELRRMALVMGGKLEWSPAVMEEQVARAANFLGRVVPQDGFCQLVS